MRERPILKRMAPVLRAAGFRGSGQTYRRTEGDFLFVINFQGSRWGDEFFVNLGAQPLFVPLEGETDLERLKEYECFLRRRVGKGWPWDMPEQDASRLQAAILSAQADFFGHAQTMRASLASDAPDVLVAKFSSGTTPGAAARHLSRAALALGLTQKARDLATHGLALVNEAAVILRTELLQLQAAGSQSPP